MEEKFLKTGVCVNETVYSDTAEQAIDIDFTLPDYCPDISKIFKCRAESRISSKGINGRTLTIDGSVTVTVLYADEDGKLCSYEYLYPFNKNFEMPDEYPGANLIVRTKCEYINCRAISGRKVDIHGAAGIYVRVIRKKTTEVISDYDDKNVELRRGTAPATTPMGYAEKYLMIEDEIPIGQGQPEIENLIRIDSKICVGESKIINDKIVVKGNLSLSILYSAENCRSPQLLKSVLPFSQIIDLEGITDHCKCDTDAQIAFLEIKPRNAVNGETRCFALTAKLLISCEAYCNNDIAVILDAYSRKYQSNLVRNNIYFERMIDNISEIYHCKKSCEVDIPINSISDLWCDLHSSNTKCSDDGIVINGNLLVGIIMNGEDNLPVYYEKPMDFEYTYSPSTQDNDIFCNPKIEVSSISYTISGPNTIDLQIDLQINCAIYQSNEISLITEITVNTDKLNERVQKGAMTIYFASEGESLWDIAKRYNADLDEIMRINNIENDKLSADRMVLVPIM